VPIRKRFVLGMPKLPRRLSLDVAAVQENSGPTAVPRRPEHSRIVDGTSGCDGQVNRWPEFGWENLSLFMCWSGKRRQQQEFHLPKLPPAEVGRG